MVCHVLNRGIGRMRLFDDDDYAAFERVLTETTRNPTRACLRLLRDAQSLALRALAGS
jgi:hypothetical protein